MRRQAIVAVPYELVDAVYDYRMLPLAGPGQAQPPKSSASSVSSSRDSGIGSGFQSVVCGSRRSIAEDLFTGLRHSASSGSVLFRGASCDDIRFRDDQYGHSNLLKGA